MTQTAYRLSKGLDLILNSRIPSLVQSPSGNPARDQPGWSKSTLPRFLESVVTFYHADKVRFSFRVSEDYQQHFILIKGLLEFHRSRRLRISYDKNTKTIDLSTAIVEIPELQSLLEDIHRWLDQELRFKLELKKILLLEERHKRERIEAYAVMLTV